MNDTIGPDGQPPPVVLVIGGSDSAGMAGVQADLRTIHALGGHGALAVTAVTAQHSGAVLGVNPVAGAILAQQLEAAKALSPRAIKIGLLATPEQAHLCAQFLRGLDPAVPVILDPVLVSSSGHALADSDDLVMVIRREIMPLCTLVTPNRHEAERFLKQPLMEAPSGRSDQARQLLDQLSAGTGAAFESGVSGRTPALLLTGGHWSASLGSNHSSDCFVSGEKSFWLTSPRIATCHQRGTGCTLASAIATAMALNHDLEDALVIGKMAVNQGLRQAYGWAAQAGPLKITEFPSHGRDLPWLSEHLDLEEPGEAFPDCGPAPLGLYPVVDRAHWLETLLPGGITTIQLRIKDLNGTDLRNELARGVEIARRYGARLFINDHWQYAIELGAYGVHLGQEDLDGADLDVIRSAGLRLGISTHCHYEVARAVRHRPSYLACGPVYPTTSKDMPWRPQRPEGLAYWRQVLSHYPLVAIGGIGRAQLDAVSAVGPDGIAMITALTQTEDPQGTAREFMAAMATSYAGLPVRRFA